MSENVSQALADIRSIDHVDDVVVHLYSFVYTDDLALTVKTVVHELVDDDLWSHAIAVLNWAAGTSQVLHNSDDWEKWLKLQSFANLPVRTLHEAGLSVRAYNAFGRAVGGYRPMHELLVLLSRGPNALMHIPHVGEVAVSELVRVVLKQKYVSPAQLREFGFGDYLPFE